MKNNTRKILLAFLVVMTLIVSMATITASAAEDSIVYLDPGSEWASNDARFAIYTWDGPAGAQWIDMTDADSDGVYEGVVPSGYSNIIFCRMNPEFTENRWNTAEEWEIDNRPVWNQTVDLILRAGGTFTITDPWAGNNKGASGSWEGGTEVEGGSGTDTPVVNPENPDISNLELAVGDYYLGGYINGADYGIVDDASNLGVYKFVDGKLSMTFEQESYVVIKDSQNTHYWTQTYIQDTIGTFFNKDATGAGEKMYVPAGRVEFTLYKGEGDTFVLTYKSSGHTGGTEGDPANAPKWDEYETITIYLGNSKEWFNPRAHIWYRADDGFDYAYTSWENDIEFEIDENFYYYIEIPSICNYIIFRDNNGEQTADLQISTNENNLYDNATGEWVKKDSYKPAPPPSDTEKGVTVAVKNDAGWEQVYCYYWSLNGIASVSWPGEEMVKGEDGLYYFTIPEGNYFVIFNNGMMEESDPAFRKTPDMKIPQDNNVLYNNGVLTNDTGDDDKNWEYLLIENKPEDKPDTPNTPDTPNDTPNDTPKMTFIQKVAKAILLFLRSIEDFFKGIFKKN
ncbi:MAG: starch-binding protein [Clostridia bacterium]|nr:starch-binding protein [Clostridia bacterium]